MLNTLLHDFPHRDPIYACSTCAAIALHASEGHSKIARVCDQSPEFLRTRSPDFLDFARTACVARSGAKDDRPQLPTYIAFPSGFAALLIDCLPSPCARLSRAPTTTKAPPLV